jgi:hypothetical protein
MTNAMSLKRKQPHDEVAADASACTPVKKIKLKLILKSPAEGTLNSAQKRKYFADEIVSLRTRGSLQALTMLAASRRCSSSDPSQEAEDLPWYTSSTHHEACHKALQHANDG